MERKRLRFLAGAASVLLSAAMCFGCQSADSSDSEGKKINLADYPFYNKEYETLMYDDAEYKKEMSRPYWLGNVIYNELTLPIAYENGEAYADLLYAPEKVIGVMDQKLKKTYSEGADYVVDKAKKRLTIPAGSSIELLSELAETGAKVPDGYELSETPDSVSKYTVWDLGGGPFVYTESSLFYGRYLSVTYAYDLAELPAGVFNAYDAPVFTSLRAKLEAGKDVSVAFIGDSITDGSSSTGDNLHVEPNTPCYAKQVKTEIERVYGVNVTFTNSAKGGTISDWPLTKEGNTSFQRAKDAKPDLCVIAYGMNDSTANPVTNPSAYQSNIEEIMLQMKGASPDCNFVLVNSFPCNPLYEREAGIFDRYLSKLNAIAEKYDDGTVKVIDMQKAGKYFLETKRYCEISSSNVNHPNDFMHRVYAMNIMTAITDYKK